MWRELFGLGLAVILWLIKLEKTKFPISCVLYENAIVWERVPDYDFYHLRGN